MKSVTIKYVLVGFTILVGIITCIHPVFSTEQFLQHVGTLALLFMLVFDLKKNQLSLTAFTGLVLFTLLHIIGARYIYSYVPYNEWCKSIFHIDVNALFHTSRNHFDRIVHFSFGAMFFPYVYELLDGKKGLNVFMKIIIAWMCIQTASMLYELFEWTLTLVLSSEAANDYNGQQGDMWDAQKDMVLALLGSTISAIGYLIKKRQER